MHRRIVLVLLLSLLALNAVVAAVSATSTIEQKVQPLVQKIDTIIKAVQIILISASVLVFMYAGYLHMTAEGQPDKEHKARRVLISGLIGLVLVVLAEVIKTVIVNLLT